MRRLTLVLSAVLVTATLASVVSLFAVSEARSQTSGASSIDKTSVSQGTFGGQTVSKTVLRGVREDVADEERLPDYSQVVGNDTTDRFRALGWQERSGGYSHGGDYAYVESGTGTKAARFKVDRPTAGDYAIYAWWPAAGANSASARFGVSTASGTKWTTVNQQRDGGMWVKLGIYEMEAGDSYAVRVSPEGGSGRVVADAVAVVRGAASPPPDGEQAGAGGEQLYSASSSEYPGREIIQVARSHIGTPYTHSPPDRCQAYKQEDCSCHTKVVFRRLDKRLADDPVRQYWRQGKEIPESQLRPGDLVFFKESGRENPITHVGIFSGHGNLIHASTYFGKVVESEMKYIDGYFGAKRLTLS